MHDVPEARVRMTASFFFCLKRVKECDFYLSSFEEKLVFMVVVGKLRLELACE